MTLLSICEELALNVGLPMPTIIVGSPDRQWVEARQFANETCEEINRRVEWGAMQRTQTVVGDGTNRSYVLPTFLSRLNSGATVTIGTGIVRPLSRAEWNALTPIAGAPRYFLFEPPNVSFWPLLGDGVSAVVRFKGSGWITGGSSDAFNADTDTSVFDETLVVKGLIARWRRQKGMDYADQEAEYEAALTDFATFDSRSRL